MKIFKNKLVSLQLDEVKASALPQRPTADMSVRELRLSGLPVMSRRLEKAVKSGLIKDLLAEFYPPVEEPKPKQIAGMEEGIFLEIRQEIKDLNRWRILSRRILTPRKCRASAFTLLDQSREIPREIQEEFPETWTLLCDQLKILSSLPETIAGRNNA